MKQRTLLYEKKDTFSEVNKILVEIAKKYLNRYEFTHPAINFNYKKK